MESGRGGKTPHAERQKNPTPGMRRLGRVLSELLADLTVDLISEQREGIIKDKCNFVCILRYQSSKNLTF